MQLELPEWIKRLLRPLKRSLVLYTAYDADYRRWYRQNFEKLSGFRDRHHGKSCFIIGNGPSLNKMDLAPLRNRYTFGLNKIYLMFDKIDLDLSYHVAVDPFVIPQSIKQFHELKCPTFINWQHGKDYFPNCEHVNFIRTFYDRDKISFAKEITNPMWDGHTVTYVAMQIAFYMGFTTVYLIGVDYSYQMKWQSINDHDPNHFDPNYNDAGQQWGPPDLDSSELAYRLANLVYERNGRKIIDATIGGKLTIFDKMSYDEALKRSTVRNDPS